MENNLVELKYDKVNEYFKKFKQNINFIMNLIKQIRHIWYYLIRS